MKELENIDDTNYKEFVESNLAILVLGTSQCVPCNAYVPIIKKLAEKYSNIRVGKVTLDKRGSIEIKKELKILSVPYTIFYKKGKKVYEDSGSKSIEELEKLTSKYFN